MRDGERHLSKTGKLGAVHHYVPQAYLKRFAITGKPDQVYAYEIDREPYPVNIRNIAGQRDFYTYTDKGSDEKTAELEEAFADIDSKDAELLCVLDTLQDGYIQLPEEQKGNLCAYISFQHTRNLQERKHWAESYGQMATVLMQAQASNEKSFHNEAKRNLDDKYDYEQLEKSRKAILEGQAEIEFDPMDQYFLGTTLQMSKELYTILMTRKKMMLVSTDTPTRRFVTSDNPVTHYLPEGTPKHPLLGVGYTNSIFQMPISPTRCLMFVNDDVVAQTFLYTREAVNRINFWTYYYADRWIFSPFRSNSTKNEYDKYKHRGPHSHVG